MGACYLNILGNNAWNQLQGPSFLDLFLKLEKSESERPTEVTLKNDVMHPPFRGALKT